MPFGSRLCVPLAPLAALALLAGCGDSGSSGPTGEPPVPVSTSTAPTDSPTDSPTVEPTPAGAIDATVVAIVSRTAAGGRTTPTAAPVDRPAQTARFVAQLTGPLAAEVRRRVATAQGSGGSAYAQVVTIGCDVPPSVTVRRTANGITIVPGKVASPLQECYAPVTTVAVVTVP